MTSLEEVKNHYRGSKEVKCLSDEKVFDITKGGTFQTYGNRDIYFLLKNRKFRIEH